MVFHTDASTAMDCNAVANDDSACLHVELSRRDFHKLRLDFDHIQTLKTLPLVEALTSLSLFAPMRMKQQISTTPDTKYAVRFEALATAG